MAVRILLVEDEDPKLHHLKTRLEQEISELQLEICRSVNSATDFLERETVDLVVLDMSLPTFDVTSTEGGGRPQGFGGIEILRYIEFADLNCKVVVISGYEAFPKGNGQVNLAELKADLNAEFPKTVFAVLRFNSVYDHWKIELREALKALLGSELS